MNRSPTTPEATSIIRRNRWRAPPPIDRDTRKWRPPPYQMSAQTTQNGGLILLAAASAFIKYARRQPISYNGVSLSVRNAK